MKKTISINISGVVFYIEEDGYDKLRNYLASIKQYFSAYEGSEEIVSDIEGRIAEKFADQQNKEAKQAITAEDVDQLIKAMGTVADFEAVADEAELSPKASPERGTIEAYSSTSDKQDATGSSSTTEPRKLVRDVKRKLIGGVCAGLAHYLNTDVLWVRLIFLVLLLGVGFVPPASGFVVVLYIAFWIAFPGRTDLEEDDKIKKLYRNPDKKVVGGVVSGVSAYTGWDLGILRFLFVLSILFFGTGIVLYLILWAITPEAKTLTDKMQMTGEPITLENIETNIKRSLNVSNSADENGITRLLLFPFRAIGMVFSALGPFLNFLLLLARIFAGVILIAIGLSMFIGFLIALTVSLGMFGVGTSGPLANHVMFGDAPLQMLVGDAHPMMFVFGFLAVAAPSVALTLLGASLITKRSLFAPSVWQSLLGVFLAGIIGSAIMIPRFASNFSRRAVVEQSISYNVGTKQLLLDVDNEAGNDNFDETQLTIEGYDSTGLKLIQRFTGRGKNRDDARANAQTIVYRAQQKDSVLTFDRNFEFKENARFRGQRLNQTLYIPYETPFTMTHRMAHFITNTIEFDRINWKGNHDGGWRDNTTRAQFKFTKEGELVCLDEKTEAQLLEEEPDQEREDQDLNDLSARMGQGEFKKTVDIKDFESLDISGAFYVQVKQGSSFKIEMDGDRKDIEELTVRKDGNKLKIEYKNGLFNVRNRDYVNILIEMPALQNVDFSGAVKSEIKGFNQNQDFDFELSGATEVVVTALNAKRIEADLSGASMLTLMGSAQSLYADVAGASKVKSFSLRATTAEVDASGASNAEVNVSDRLKAMASGVSTIRYRGAAKIDKDVSGGSSVESENGDE